MGRRLGGGSESRLKERRTIDPCREQQGADIVRPSEYEYPAKKNPPRHDKLQQRGEKRRGKSHISRFPHNTLIRRTSPPLSARVASGHNQQIPYNLNKSTEMALCYLFWNFVMNHFNSISKCHLPCLFWQPCPLFCAFPATFPPLSPCIPCP